MSRSAPIFLAVSLFALAFQVTPATALNDRSFVSGLGDDGNACTRIAPCKTFQAAHDKTSAGGVINCVDPAEYGRVIINKSISIDCVSARGSITTYGVNAVTLGTVATDVVRIIGIDMQELSGAEMPKTFNLSVGITNINLSKEESIGQLHISNVTVRGYFYGMHYSLKDYSQIFITDSTISNNIVSGIIFNAGYSGSAINAHLSRVIIENNYYGIYARNNLGVGVNINISDSMISGNVYGVNSEGPHVNTSITGTRISGNFSSAITASGLASVRIGSSMISANATAFTSESGGRVFSFGNNQVNSNSGGEDFSGMVGLK